MFRSKEAIKLLPPPLSFSSVSCLMNHTAVPTRFPLHLCSASPLYQRLTKTHRIICLTGRGTFSVRFSIIYMAYVLAMFGLLFICQEARHEPK